MTIICNASPELEIIYPRRKIRNQIIGCSIILCLAVGGLLFAINQHDWRMTTHMIIVGTFFVFGIVFLVKYLKKDPVHYKITKKGIEFRIAGFQLKWSEILEVGEIVFQSIAGAVSPVSIIIDEQAAKRLSKQGWIYRTKKFNRERKIFFSLRSGHNVERGKLERILFHYVPEKFHFQSYQFEEMVKSET